MTKTSPLIRFFLDTDEDGNWHVIPVARRADWVAWQADSTNIACPGPDWATPIDRCDSISFADWREEV